MRLNELLAYQSITIQVHDNPDADAIASGYALYQYFRSKGKKVALIYSGRYRIQKTNLKMMIEKLSIPIVYREMQEGKISGLLLTVDCQYGAGNVYQFAADYIAVIDHHQKEIQTGELVAFEISSNLGSCATLVWRMLLEAGYPVNEDTNLGTALYYGLYRDTNQFSEICYPLDMDMREAVTYDKAIIHLLRNSNLSIKELEIAGLAMIRYSYNKDYQYAIIQAQPCDPNLLGLISDFVIQADEITTCIVFNELEDGFKFSVRSCTKEVMASELARFLAQGMGTGGGHIEKAGGFISLRKFEQTYPGQLAETYFANLMNRYFETYDIVDIDSCVLSLADMKKYVRRNIEIGYVPTTRFFTKGTEVVIRTLERDIEHIISDDSYILVSETDTVVILPYEEMITKYQLEEEACKMMLEYEPRIKNVQTGESKEVLKDMKRCSYLGTMMVYAKPLQRGVKIFSKEYPNSYLVGNPGDYLVNRCDHVQGYSIVRAERFHQIYQEAD